MSSKAPKIDDAKRNHEGKEDSIKRTLLKELNFKAGDKVMISPIGEVTGADGRTFSISPDIIKNIKTHIPLDENHNFGRAVGWFSKESLEVREDGIYATLEPTTEGTELIDSKAYRYMSPVFTMADNRTVTGIDSVGLVNSPNLLFIELNKKENPKEQNSVDEATKAALAEKDKKIAELEAAKAELEAKVKELEAAAQTSAANAKTAKVDALIASGAITDEQKAFALELNDKQLDEFAEKNKKLLEFAGDRLKLEANKKDGDGLAADELKLCKQMGITPAEYLKTKNEGQA